MLSGVELMLKFKHGTIEYDSSTLGPCTYPYLLSGQSKTPALEGVIP